MGGGAHGAEGQTKPAERGSEGRCTGRSHRLCPRAGEGGGEALAHVAAVPCRAVPFCAVLRRAARRQAGPEHVQLQQAPGREPQRRGCEPGGEEGP